MIKAHEGRGTYSFSLFNSSISALGSVKGNWPAGGKYLWMRRRLTENRDESLGHFQGCQHNLVSRPAHRCRDRQPDKSVWPTSLFFVLKGDSLVGQTLLSGSPTRYPSSVCFCLWQAYQFTGFMVAIQRTHNQRGPLPSQLSPGCCTYTGASLLIPGHLG